MKLRDLPKPCLAEHLRITAEPGFGADRVGARAAAILGQSRVLAG